MSPLLILNFFLILIMQLDYVRINITTCYGKRDKNSFRQRQPIFYMNDDYILNRKP
jgi:hypothetical protein